MLRLQRLAVPIMPRRQIVTSVSLQMPRKGRPQLAEEAEDEATERWGDYSRNLTPGLGGDMATFTGFGSIRLDSQNLPRGSPSSLDKHRFPSGQAFSEQGADGQHENVPSDYFGIPVGGDSGQFDKFTPFNIGEQKNPMKMSDGRKYAFQPPNNMGQCSEEKEENQTIPVNFGSEASERVKSNASQNDFNYFDEIMFQESYDKFKMSDGRKDTFNPPTNTSSYSEVKDDNRTIPVNLGKRASESFKSNTQSDFNYFDEIVFQESYEKFNPDSAKTPQAVIVEPEVLLLKEQTLGSDLNYIDQIYFGQSNAPEIEKVSAIAETQIKSQVEKENKKKKISSKHESDLASDVEEKPSKVEKQKVKTSKKKEKARLATEGTALEYVRKLRKMTDSSSSSTHPKEMLGKHLQDRMLAAAANLQRADTVKKVDSRDVEEDGAETLDNYVDVKKYKPPDLLKYTRLEVKDVLLSKIIYDDHDIVAVWKPYGLPMFQGKKAVIKKRENMTHSMECFLPDIAAKVKCETLHEVHRLDATTTGVLLYAKTKEMELKLRKLFAERKIRKNYLAVCNGTAQAASGVIDIPIGDGKFGDRVRKTLRPDYNSNKIVTNKKTSDLVHEDAVTEYTVLSSVDNASFVSTSMHSGRKHQIRLHLGLGLGIPILGDHKFSYPTEIGKPQKIHGDILQKLKLKKSKSRHLPIYLHARRVTVPNILPNGNDLVVVATLPHFFSKTLQKLKLKTKHY